MEQIITEKEIKALNQLAAKERTRFAITAIHADDNNLISTNGRAMARISLSRKITKSDNDLIDAKEALAIIKQRTKIGGEKSMIWDDMQTATNLINGRKVLGKFPDYKMVIEGPLKVAKERKDTKIFNVKALIESLNVFKDMGISTINLAAPNEKQTVLVLTSQNVEVILTTMNMTD